VKVIGENNILRCLISCFQTKYFMCDKNLKIERGIPCGAMASGEVHTVIGWRN